MGTLHAGLPTITWHFPETAHEKVHQVELVLLCSGKGELGAEDNINYTVHLDLREGTR